MSVLIHSLHVLDIFISAARPTPSRVGKSSQSSVSKTKIASPPASAVRRGRSRLSAGTDGDDADAR